MKVGEHIHWYPTAKCNMKDRCLYCFGPYGIPDGSGQRLEDLANILVENQVKKITVSGGEPLLVKDLDRVLKILKDGGIYISLHTNAMLLDEARIADLAGLVDDIALPIDSTDRETQRYLRGEEFLPTFDTLQDLAKAIVGNGIGLGYHTVFTEVNHLHIPEIYHLIREVDFDYWRIYEFRDGLALLPLFERGEKEEDANELRKIEERIMRIEDLAEGGTPEKGFIDCLYANFLLMEQRMKQHRDKRIQFVATIDIPTPYAFLYNSGDVGYYSWFSQRERWVIGNILTHGFPFVRAKLQEVQQKRWEFDDNAQNDFDLLTTFTMVRDVPIWTTLFTTVRDAPIWTRLYYGGYGVEEIEEISPEYWDDFFALEKLHLERVARLPSSI